MFLDRKTVIKMTFFLNCHANLKRCESEEQIVLFWWGGGEVMGGEERTWAWPNGASVCIHHVLSFLCSDALTSGASLSPERLLLPGLPIPRDCLWVCLPNANQPVQSPQSQSGPLSHLSLYLPALIILCTKHLDPDQHLLKLFKPANAKPGYFLGKSQ